MFLYLSLFQVDHFGFENSDTYEQRYLLADQFWDKNGGPIFFYTGNEGDITWFCNNTVRKLLFIWEVHWRNISMPFHYKYRSAFDAITCLNSATCKISLNRKMFLTKLINSVYLYAFVHMLEIFCFENIYQCSIIRIYLKCRVGLTGNCNVANLL